MVVYRIHDWQHTGALFLVFDAYTTILDANNRRFYDITMTSLFSLSSSQGIIEKAN